MNYYLNNKKITLEQLKEEFEKNQLSYDWMWSHDWITVFRIEKITSKSIYFIKQEYKI